MTRAWWTGADSLLNELDALQRHMSNVLGEGGLARAASIGEFPPVNIGDCNGDLEVTAEVPGMRLEDIDVSIVGEVLTIRGERKPEDEAAEATFYRRERLFGSFVRSLQLPQLVDGDKAEARYTNGVLSIRIPKAAETQPRRVQIRAL